MGLFDFLRANEYKQEIDRLNKLIKKNSAMFKKRSSKYKAEIIRLRAIVEEYGHYEAEELKQVADQRRSEIVSLENKIKDLDRTIQNKKRMMEDDIRTFDLTIRHKEAEVAKIKAMSVDASNILEFESHGLFTPQYEFVTSVLYKERLDEIRAQQKKMVKDKTATHHSLSWSVEGSEAKGKAMINDTIKQILRSFNHECEVAIDKATYRNYETIEKRIRRSFDQLNKMNTNVNVSIKESYYKLKLDELNVAYSYRLKKEEEKEIMREEKVRLREEKARRDEINRKKKVLNRDVEHNRLVIDSLQQQLREARELLDNERSQALEREIQLASDKVADLEDEKEHLEDEDVNARAGYVYIISNIGSFGESILKIGVTRRLDPHLRISELSSASVPFKFDVHAMIFSQDAYALETELHQHFDAYRVNKVNKRKEFFRVDPETIGQVLEKYRHLTFDFNPVPQAEEYYQTLEIKA